MKKVATLKALLCALFCFLLLIPAISGCKEKNDINDNPLIPSESQKEEDKPALYSAKASLIMGYGDITAGSSSKISNSDLASSLNIVDTIIDVLETRSFYEVVAEQPEIKQFGFTAEDIRDITSVLRRDEMSLVIDLEVIYSDPEAAAVIVNCIAESAPEHTKSILPGACVLVLDKCISAKPVE